MVLSVEQLPLVQQVVVSELISCELDIFGTQPFSVMCKRLAEKDRILSHHVRVKKNMSTQNYAVLRDDTGEHMSHYY